MPAPSIGNHDDQQDAYRCTHCSRLLFADELERFACRVCEDRAGGYLRSLPDLYADLGQALRPGATASEQGVRVAASKSAPLPVALQPLNLRGPGGMVTLLRDVEDAWRKTLGRTKATFAGDHEQTLAAVVMFLRINLQAVCERYEFVADDLDVISSVYWQARNAVTGHRPRLIPVICRSLVDEEKECGSQLRVDINRASVKCAACGTRWGRDEWVALYEATKPAVA